MYRSWWRPYLSTFCKNKMVFTDSISIVSITPFLDFVVQTAYVLLHISETLARKRSGFEHKFINKIWSHGTSGGSSYRDKGIIPSNKFKLIRFLFYFQNLVSPTLRCVKFHFCYITCRLFIIHHYIKFSVNVVKYCSYAAPLTLDWRGRPHFKGLLSVSYTT